LAIAGGELRGLDERFHDGEDLALAERFVERAAQRVDRETA